MEVLLFVLKWVAGPLVSIAVTLLFSDKLKEVLAPIVLALGSKKKEGVTGKWLATFYYGEERIPYPEVIEISTLLGSSVGRIIEHRGNHPRIAEAVKSKPLRLRGNVEDHRFFTGLWFHPVKTSHYHGAFELIVHQDGQTMSGLWIGYSESKNGIETGEWRWERLHNTNNAEQAAVLNS